MANNRIRNRTMPDCTILPVLYYRNVEQAIKWLSDSFGFKERWRAGNHRAQMAFEGGVIVVAEAQNKAPAGHTHDRHSILVQIENADSHFENSKSNGAVIINPPTDHHYGERQYSVLDPEGHRWTFSQSIKDLAPEDWGGTTVDLS